MAGRGLKNLGDWGERVAIDFLVRHGYRIIAQNFFTTVGEIDIVAEKGGDFYFVEVKTRLNPELANDTAITKTKIRRMTKSAKIFCYQRRVSGGSIILAGLVVAYDQIHQKVKVRLAVLQGW